MRFGLYRAGTSPVHRTPAGVKLALLVVVGGALAVMADPWPVVVVLVVVLALYRVAGFGGREIWQQSRPLLLFLLVIGIVHGLTDTLVGAAVTVGALLAVVLLAALVTLTTRTTALIDVVVALLRPLRGVGVDPERVGLLLALGVRSVPVVLDLASEVREAQHARGLRASPRAFAVPLVVRSLRHADALGEALAARGADD